MILDSLNERRGPKKRSLPARMVSDKIDCCVMRQTDLQVSDVVCPVDVEHTSHTSRSYAELRARRKADVQQRQVSRQKQIHVPHVRHYSVVGTTIRFHLHMRVFCLPLPSTSKLAFCRNFVVQLFHGKSRKIYANFYFRM